MFNLNQSMLVIILMTKVRKLALHLCQNMFNSVMKSHKKKLHLRKLPHKLKSNQQKKLHKSLKENKLDQLLSPRLRFTMMLLKLDNLWQNNKLKWKCKLKKLKENPRLEIMLLPFLNKKVIPKNIKFKV